MYISKNTVSGLNFVSVLDRHDLPAAVKMVKNNEVDGIAFNFIKNWPENDIDIIADCPNIKFLYIHYAPFDYSVINKLENLVQLGIDNDDRNEIIFTNKPNLKYVSLFWRTKAKSLFECRQLENLWIGKYNGMDLNEFKNFSKLNTLRINTGSIVKLTGIEKLINLQNLYLAQTNKLVDISGLDTLSNLKLLTIDNCKRIENIDIIQNLINLQYLDIMGTTPKILDGKNSKHF